MVGLGESLAEVGQVMDDLRAAGVDFLTIGQYLQPTPKHHAVERFVEPDEFRRLEERARAKGFLLVSASPLTRSSYHADRDFAALKAARAEQAERAEKERGCGGREEPAGAGGAGGGTGAGGSGSAGCWRGGLRPGPARRFLKLGPDAGRMAALAERREVAHPPELLFAVVCDVGAYPLFLPWCLKAAPAAPPAEAAAAAKPAEAEAKAGASVSYWRLDVGWGPLRESYVSRVTVRAAAGGGGTVESTAVAGPLKQLESRWRIEAGETRGTSSVAFEVSFSFRGLVLERLAEAAFRRVSAEMVRAFERRAAALAALPCPRPRP